LVYIFKWLTRKTETQENPEARVTRSIRWNLGLLKRGRTRERSLNDGEGERAEIVRAKPAFRSFRSKKQDLRLEKRESRVSETEPRLIGKDKGRGEKDHGGEDKSDCLIRNELRGVEKSLVKESREHKQQREKVDKTVGEKNL